MSSYVSRSVASAAIGAIVFGLLNVPAGQAQSQKTGTATPAFEVASVKPSSSPQAAAGMAMSAGLPPLEERGDHGNVNYSRVTLEGLIMRAYSLLPFDMVAPSWMAGSYYDVIARAPQGTPYGQVPAMLQNLLAERFQMRVHWDTKQEAGYALTVAKTGLKLKRLTNASGAPLSEADAEARRGPSASFSTSPDGTVRIGVRNTTMERFAKSLRADLRRPVVDTTGIEGLYDIAFVCSMDSLPGLPRMGALSDSGPGPAPSVFSAIRDLGLELVSRSVPVKRLIVDSALKVPTEN